MRRKTESGWVLPPEIHRAEHYLASGEWTRETMADAMCRRVAEAPDRLIVADSQEKLTRIELQDRAIRLGSALHRRGLRPGSVVAFQLPNWTEACVISLACALYGYVLTPLLLMYRERELGFILSQTGCQVLFRPAIFNGFDYAALLQRALKETGQTVDVYSVRGGPQAGVAYEGLLAESSVVDMPAVDPASVKAITFTSGTTGRPKGVLHSHYTAHATVLRAAAFWALGEADRLLVASPVGHIGGSLYAFELPFFTGCSAHLLESWDPAVAVGLIDGEGLTFCAGATPFLQGLLGSAQAAGTTLPSLRRFVCGGASVPPALVAQAADGFRNAVISRAYGSSESPIICPGVRTREDGEYGQTTDGEIDAEVRIVDAHGEDLLQGAVGDIIARSCSTFIGYLEADDEREQFTGDGFFRTGDIGRVVDGRFLEITGRRKELIIRMGENISPLEVENGLLECEAVKRVAVVGVPNERTGERAVAFVELKDGAGLTFADMQAFLGKIGLAKQKWPEELHILERLPTNSIGKVQKSELKLLADKSPAAAPQPGGAAR